MVASLMKSMFLNAKNSLSCSSSQTSLLRLGNSHPFLPKTRLTAPLIYHNLHASAYKTTINMNNTRRCWFHFQQLVKCCKSRYCLSRIALFAAMCSVRFERVPFSDRYTVVLAWPKFSWIPSWVRTRYGHIWLWRACDYGKYDILPPTDPKTIRVTDMVRKMVQTMHSTLELQKDSTIKPYILHPTIDIPPQYRIRSNTGHRHTNLFESRIYGTKHLEGREWKVAVTESPEIGALLLPNCTILVGTQYLDNVSDPELAYSVGHELGHYIARSYCENAWRSLIVLLVVMPITVMVNYLGLGPPPPPQRPTFDTYLWSLHKHRQEFEADYIGMMLMASAGYDPQIAPEFELKEFYEDIINSSHPSSIKRRDSLQQPVKMEKAMEAYNKAKRLAEEETFRK